MADVINNPLTHKTVDLAPNTYYVYLWISRTEYKLQDSVDHFLELFIFLSLNKHLQIKMQSRG